MLKNKYLYYVSTVLIVLPMLGGGVMDTMNGPEVQEIMTHLGFPMWFATFLGIWKLLGVVAVLVPGFPRLKEWAYAGFTFDLVAASVAHLAVGDAASNVVTPLVILVFNLLSWASRPESRRLAG